MLLPEAILFIKTIKNVQAMTNLEKRVEIIEDTLIRLFDSFMLHDEGLTQQLYDAITEIGNDFYAAKNSVKNEVN